VNNIHERMKASKVGKSPMLTREEDLGVSSWASCLLEGNFNHYCGNEYSFKKGFS